MNLIKQEKATRFQTLRNRFSPKQQHLQQQHFNKCVHTSTRDLRQWLLSLHASIKVFSSQRLNDALPISSFPHARYDKSNCVLLRQKRRKTERQQQFTLFQQTSDRYTHQKLLLQ
ncbi:hypothetical protein CDAR_246331 [Caerostris darwini]|uniref:Uncharacterized protein n=1 Tax=Caerostris darwini TaxID=1538125 RepID=A0AAV4W8I3_9ARAC|nr:hypothetical protein CDAR_246331 [Caerostris darwini]